MMKRYLLALMFSVVLIGCVGPLGKEQATPTAMPNKALFMHYSWQLQEARNMQGAPIAPLFAQANKFVQVDFNNERFHVSNICNNMSGQYLLDANRIVFSNFVSTRKMCIDNKIAALDNEIGSRLKEVIIYRIIQTVQPTLVFTTSSGDTLKFVGTQTPVARYGSEGETIFLEVAPQVVSCVHPPQLNRQCLQVRQIHYGSDGIKTGSSGPWQIFYQNIEGYTFQPGIRNVLRVKRYKVINSPADASNIVYILDMVVESEIVELEKPPKSGHQAGRLPE